jgi:hypothetical protein
VPQGRQAAAEAALAEASRAPKLESKYGIDAWERWVRWRRDQPDLPTPRIHCESAGGKAHGAGGPHCSVAPPLPQRNLQITCSLSGV